MSAEAPWVALAVDWDESDMWDALPQYGIEEESTMGERLAWVCLMCDAKKKGRGGKVSIRKSVFQKHHRLTGRAVDGMLHRAQKCGAIEINGDFISLCNWATYQDKKGGKKRDETTDSPGSAVPITHHQPPITNHQGQVNTRATAFVKPTVEEVAAYCRERKNRVDPQRFIDHYESNGWCVGKNPMRNWKAAVRTWEKNSYDNGHGATRRPEQSRSGSLKST